MMIKFKTEKFAGTFVAGISFSKYKTLENKKRMNLIFDLGVRSFAIIVGKK